jgi:hypothetical protein
LLSFDKTFVDDWSRHYLEADKSGGGNEQELFGRVGPQVAKRGYYRKAELAMVGDWKSPRIRSLLARNSDEDVRDISRLALGAPERLQHRILGLLVGVKDPVASALLAVSAPDRYTVIDFRAVEALEELRSIGALKQEVPPHSTGELPDYIQYLDCCRSIARQCGVGFVTWTGRSGNGAKKGCRPRISELPTARGRRREGSSRSGVIQPD